MDLTPDTRMVTQRRMFKLQYIPVGATGFVSVTTGTQEDATKKYHALQVMADHGMITSPILVTAEWATVHAVSIGNAIDLVTGPT